MSPRRGCLMSLGNPVMMGPAHCQALSLHILGRKSLEISVSLPMQVLIACRRKRAWAVTMILLFQHALQSWMWSNFEAKPHVLLKCNPHSFKATDCLHRYSTPTDTCISSQLLELHAFSSFQFRSSGSIQIKRTKANKKVHTPCTCCVHSASVQLNKNELKQKSSSFHPLAFVFF